MWKLLLLFVVLTPGILFTVPVKKGFRGVSPTILVAAVHALIFVVIVNLFRVSEGFQTTNPLWFLTPWIPIGCIVGFRPSDDGRSCVPDPECPPGTTRNQYGICQGRLIIDCAPGYRQSGDTCVPDPEYLRLNVGNPPPGVSDPYKFVTSETTISCARGYRQSGDTCVPDPEYLRLNVPKPPPGESDIVHGDPRCPPGTMWEQDTCVPYPNDPRLNDNRPPSGVSNERYDIPGIISRINNLIFSLENKSSTVKNTQNKARNSLVYDTRRLHDLQAELNSIQMAISNATAATRDNIANLENQRLAVSSANDKIIAAQRALELDKQQRSLLAGSEQTLNAKLADAMRLLSMDSSKINEDKRYVDLLSGSVKEATIKQSLLVKNRELLLRGSNKGAVANSTNALTEVTNQLRQLIVQLNAGNSRVANDIIMQRLHTLSLSQIKTSLTEINLSIIKTNDAIEIDMRNLETSNNALNVLKNRIAEMQAYLSANTNQNYSLNSRANSINREISDGSSRIASNQKIISDIDSSIAIYQRGIIDARDKLVEAENARRTNSMDVFGYILKWLNTVSG
jgi:hypothetical protein